MNLDDSAREVLEGTLESAVAKGAESLGKIFKTPCRARLVALEARGGQEPPSALAREEQDRVAVCFSMPGEMFLTLFSPDDARRAAQAFLSNVGPRARAVPGLEDKALAELSNIVVNAVSVVIADRCRLAKIIAAPRVLRGPCAELAARALGEFRADGKDFIAAAVYRLSLPEASCELDLAILLDTPLVALLLNP